jgi:hypothetical protein
VTSIAYRAEPPRPGWTWAIGSLLVGWILAGAAALLLYVGASLIGAIGQSSALNGSSYPGDGLALNEWPYPDNGWWSLFANIAVVALVLVLTTKATSLWMRRSYDHVSDERLSLVLLLTGWLPLRFGGPIGGFFGFVVAVVLARTWVAGAQYRLPGRTAAAMVTALGAFVAVYGLLHPLWAIDVIPPGAGHARTTMVVMHNAALVSVRVDGFSVSPPLGRVEGGQGPFGFPARSDRFLVQRLPQGGCGTLVVGVRARYHVFGLPLTQSVPAFVSLGRC